MTSIEIRLLTYGLALLAIVGGSAWIGHRFTARHYEALMARDHAAQSAALESAQRAVIAQQAQQAAAEQRAEQDH